jgi:cytochrome c oxidase assembly factor CtaG
MKQIIDQILTCKFNPLGISLQLKTSKKDLFKTNGSKAYFSFKQRGGGFMTWLAPTTITTKFLATTCARTLIGLNLWLHFFPCIFHYFVKVHLHVSFVNTNFLMQGFFETNF